MGRAAERRPPTFQAGPSGRAAASDLSGGAERPSGGLRPFRRGRAAERRPPTFQAGPSGRAAASDLSGGAERPSGGLRPFRRGRAAERRPPTFQAGPSGRAAASDLSGGEWFDLHGISEVFEAPDQALGVSSFGAAIEVI